MKRTYLGTFAVKPAHEKILFALSQYHLLTNDLVVRAVGSVGSSSTVKKNLQDLAEKNYIFRFQLATPSGRGPLICVLAEQGMKYLRDEKGYEIDFYRHASEWKSMSSSWLMHPLELNKFIIAANQLTRLYSQITLPNWEHDFLLKSSPMLTTSKTGEKYGVIPDAILPFYLTLKNREQKRRILWIELERDTHREKAFVKKLAGIFWVCVNHVFETRYNHPLPRVVFLSTVSHNHVDWMQMKTREMLLTFQGRIEKNDFLNRLFYFGYVPALQDGDIEVTNTFTQPSWFHPFGIEKYPLLD